MSVTIYHNPRCSKSRQTLQLLKDQGVEPEVVEYLDTPPSKETLTRILKMLGLTPRELMRRKEAEYKVDVWMSQNGVMNGLIRQYLPKKKLR